MNWNPTDYEKELVKLTWSDDFSFLYELGTAIYTVIFRLFNFKLIFIFSVYF